MTKKETKVIENYTNNPFPLGDNSKKSKNVIKALRALRDSDPMEIVHPDGILDPYGILN